MTLKKHLKGDYLTHVINDLLINDVWFIEITGNEIRFNHDFKDDYHGFKEVHIGNYYQFYYVALGNHEKSTFTTDIKWIVTYN